ncbi:hypothetical protein NTE_00677 [Candidatus Nitrososphaera evergladensis SR1]|uniref:Uncharacterized protein n=1 Tax=Candidatus Nitrososphaera evergladensis SR1 TaxID=1459636 RepID=A0A075MPL3_9ARCH|nr:hypothetical protein [Candidatus Nitrososphaera evergladensis]AIF82757.1 hypothetical protein NTE_00677 [Candidatus Nitrososphaera evergladensis SR1]
MTKTTITANKKVLTFVLLALGVAMIGSVMAAPTAAFAVGGDHYDHHDHHDDGHHHHHHHHDGDHDHRHHHKHHDHDDDYDW